VSAGWFVASRSPAYLSITVRISSVNACASPSVSHRNERRPPATLRQPSLSRPSTSDQRRSSSRHDQHDTDRRHQHPGDDEGRPRTEQAPRALSLRWRSRRSAHPKIIRSSHATERRCSRRGRHRHHRGDRRASGHRGGLKASAYLGRVDRLPDRARRDRSGVPSAATCPGPPFHSSATSSGVQIRDPRQRHPRGLQARRSARSASSTSSSRPQTRSARRTRSRAACGAARAHSSARVSLIASDSHVAPEAEEATG
jgi:hypothetical protein